MENLKQAAQKVIGPLVDSKLWQQPYWNLLENLAPAVKSLGCLTFIKPVDCSTQN